MANEHRLELLMLLSDAPHSVESLAAHTSMEFANVSQHLQILKASGLVLGRREGKSVIYKLGDGPIREVLDAVQSLTAHTAKTTQEAVDDYFHGRERLQTISAREVLSLLRDGSIVLLDVRPADEFGSGHLKGARNIAIEELEHRMSELPKNKEIVAYCRGPTCILSVRAAQRLKAQGYKVRRLKEGFQEWKHAGLLTE
jgi:ArsR family transcriptional regulator